MRLPTSSALTRAKSCPPSAALPVVKRESEWSDLGSAAHKYLEDVATHGPEKALSMAPEKHRAFLDGIDLSTLPKLGPGIYAHEVAFAYDSSTGKARELARGRGRDYTQASPGENCGTADIVALDGEHGVYVGDWKFGGKPVPPARENLQLLSLGLYAGLAYGRSMVTVEIIHRYPDGRVYRDRAFLDDAASRATAETIAEINDGVAEAHQLIQLGEVPTVTIGDHCKHCPALPYCPGQWAIVRQAYTDPEAVKERFVALLDYEHVPRAWSVATGLEELAGFMKQAMSALAAEKPIEVRPGVWLGAKESKREYLDGKAVYALLKARFGEAVASAAVSYDASKVGLRDALRTIGGSVKKLETEILEELRASGGTRITTTNNVREYRAKGEDES